MCAIVGGQKSAIEGLGGLGTLWTKLAHRGVDSYGLMWFIKGELHTTKAVSKKAVLKVYRGLPNDAFVLAHNRAASIGAITEELAHPIKYGDITVIHNGTNRSLYSNSKDATSDTVAVAQGLNNSHVKVDYFNIHGFAGIGVVFWYDKVTKRLGLSKDPIRHLFVKDNVIISEPIVEGTYKLVGEVVKVIEADDVHTIKWDEWLPTVGEITIGKTSAIKQCAYCNKKHVHNVGDDVCSVCMVQGNKLSRYIPDKILEYNTMHRKGPAWIANPEKPTGTPQVIYGSPLVTKDGRVLLVKGATNSENFLAYPIHLPKAVKGDIVDIYEFYEFWENTGTSGGYHINMLMDLEDDWHY